MVSGVIVSASGDIVKAAESAEALVSDALTNMSKYDVISYSYSRNRNIDDSVRTRTGMCASDNRIDHGFYIDLSESRKAWEGYTKKNKIYWKGYSESEWTTYEDKDYDSTSPNSYTNKKWMEYMLGNLKEMKVTNVGNKSYTITAKTNYKGSNIKKVILEIDKDKGLVNSIRIKYKDYSAHSIDTGDEYFVKNQVIVWSNICYGKGMLKIPGGL